MIRAAGPQDGPLLQKKAATLPYIGTEIAVMWRLQQQNPLLPYRVFLAGGTPLALTGTEALFCGGQADQTELDAFLRLCGTEWLTSPDEPLPGWAAPTAEWLMVRRPGQPATPATPPAGLDTAPTPHEALALLEEGGSPWQPAWRDSFYADWNVRRNHGVGRAFGLRRQGQLVSLARLTCADSTHGNINCVKTLHSDEGQGLMTTLLHHICASHPQMEIALLCRKELAPFYERIGFACQGRVFIASPRPEALRLERRGS